MIQNNEIYEGDVITYQSNSLSPKSIYSNL